MAKEFFHYPETAKVFDLLEEASHRSGVSRGQAFEDFLTMSVCSLSGGRMEEEYLQTVAKHTAGTIGKRGCDSIAKMFGELVGAMEQDTRDQMKDILGDLFQGCISYGEHGQFLTPTPVCELMARMTLPEAIVPTNDESAPQSENPPSDAPPAKSELPPFPGRRTVCDPCSGSGRMLLAAASIHRDWEFVGQDVDLRCVRMTALNLAFRNLYGYVIWGNSLAVEKKLVYRTGFDGCGVLREIPLAACPAPVQRVVKDAGQVPEKRPDKESIPTAEAEPGHPHTQLRLF
jgi:hypothetical protein